MNLPKREDQLALLVLGGLLAIAFGLRIVDVGVPPLGLSELFTWRQAQGELAGTIRRALQGGASPLQVIILRAVQALAGDSAYALRLPSVLFSVGTVGLAYLLARRIGPASAGLLAAALLTFHGSDIAAARQAGDTALLGFATLLFGLFVIGFFDRTGDEDVVPERRPEPVFRLFLGIGAGLLVLYSHPAAVVSWAALLSGVFIIRFSSVGRRREALWPLVVSQIVAGLGYLPYVVARLSPSVVDSADIPSNFWRQLPAASSGGLGLLVLGTGIVLVFAQMLPPAKRLLRLPPVSDRMALAAIWVVALLGLSVGLAGNVLPLSSRDALLTFPAVSAILAGTGYMLVLPPRWFRYALLAGVTAAMALVLVQFKPPGAQDYRPLAQMIRNEIKSGGCVLVGPRQVLAALRYELRDLDACLKALAPDAALSTQVGPRKRVLVVTEKGTKPTLVPEQGMGWEQKREVVRKEATVTIYRRKADAPAASPAQ